MAIKNGGVHPPPKSFSSRPPEVLHRPLVVRGSHVPVDRVEGVAARSELPLCIDADVEVGAVAPERSEQPIQRLGTESARNHDLQLLAAEVPPDGFVVREEE